MQQFQVDSFSLSTYNKNIIMKLESIDKFYHAYTIA